MNARVSSANFAGCPGAADESGSFEIATPAKVQATPRSIWRRLSPLFLFQFDVEPSITSSVMKQKVFFGAVVGLMTALPGTAAERLETLPQTKPLEWEEIDLSSRLMDGAHRFIERKIEESVVKRNQFWSRDFSSTPAYAKSVQPNRAHFQTIIGAAGPRHPARMGRFGD